MAGPKRVLGSAAARTYYDRFGGKQDSQGFYENPALDDLVAHADFQDTGNVFEFGCGTGRFAARLLGTCLPSSASYLGCDLSPVMLGLAKDRLEAFGERARVVLSDGAVRFPVPDHSVDRVVCNYVLDLLAEEDMERFFSEARRVMRPCGKVCVASLTEGVNLPSRIVSSLWMAVFRLSPALVGGCRPIRIDAGIEPREWQVVHRRVVTPFGVPSEVLIMKARGVTDGGLEPPTLSAAVQPEPEIGSA